MALTLATIIKVLMIQFIRIITMLHHCWARMPNNMLHLHSAKHLFHVKQISLKLALQVVSGVTDTDCSTQTG